MKSTGLSSRAMVLGSDCLVNSILEKCKKSINGA